MPKDADRKRVLKALREVADSPKTDARSMAAKYAASAKLAKLTGMEAEAEREAAGELPDDQAPDPMAYLDDLETQRIRRARKGRR